MNIKSILIVTVIIAALLGALYLRYHGRATDERGATRLMQYIEQQADKKDTFKLIAKSSNLNITDKEGRSALFYAAQHAQDIQLIQKLLASGANLHLADSAGKTALMTAAQYNANPAVLAELLKAGAHPNAVDGQGNTALMLAAKENNPEVFKILLRGLSDPEIKNAEGKTASDLLEENPHFTEQQKKDYRQALLIVSLLRPIK